jgi:peptidoglycan/LPS O-acetylase OafA/YrhL
MNRAPGLDLLRAFAIAWVMLFHAWAMLSTSYAIDAWHQPFAAFQSYGWMGVDLFFVLSGYLIGTQVLKPLSKGLSFSFADFYLRRAFRILPVFLLVLALYFCWPAFREASGIQPLWQFLTFTMNLLIDYQHNKAFSHAWSLCVEEHFYLLFPLLAWWMTRCPSIRTFTLVVAGVLCGGMLLRSWIWTHELAPLSLTDDSRFNQRFIEDIYFPTWARLDGLLAGVALATIKCYRAELWATLQRWSNQILLLGLVVSAVTVVIFQDRAGWLATVFGYPLLSLGFALLVIAGAGTAAATRRALATIRVPGAHWLAAISYSLYLSHKAVMHMVHTVFAPALEGHYLVSFIVYALAVLLAGTLLHYAVERPFLQLRDRFLSRSRPGPAQSQIASA